MKCRASGLESPASVADGDGSDEHVKGPEESAVGTSRVSTDELAEVSTSRWRLVRLVIILSVVAIISAINVEEGTSKGVKLDCSVQYLEGFRSRALGRRVSNDSSRVAWCQVVSVRSQRNLGGKRRHCEIKTSKAGLI